MSDRKRQAGDIYANGNDLYIIVSCRNDEYAPAWVHNGDAILSRTDSTFATVERAMYNPDEDKYVCTLDKEFWKNIEKIYIEKRDS